MVFEKFMSADLSQIARAKPCDYLLIIYMQKIWLAFPLLRLTACQKFLSSLLQLTTLTKIGLNFDRWILMDKIAEAKLKICFTENSSLLSFYVFNFSCFSTAATERNTTTNEISLHCCALFTGVLIEESVATVVVHAGFYRTVTEKTKCSNLTY